MEDNQSKRDLGVSKLASKSLAVQLAEAKQSKNLLGDIRKETRSIVRVLKNWKLEDVSRLNLRLDKQSERFSKLKQKTKIEVKKPTAPEDGFDYRRKDSQDQKRINEETKRQNELRKQRRSQYRDLRKGGASPEEARKKVIRESRRPQIQPPKSTAPSAPTARPNIFSGISERFGNIKTSISEGLNLRNVAGKGLNLFERFGGIKRILEKDYLGGTAQFLSTLPGKFSRGKTGKGLNYADSIIQAIGGDPVGGAVNAVQTKVTSSLIDKAINFLPKTPILSNVGKALGPAGWYLTAAQLSLAAQQQREKVLNPQIKQLEKEIKKTETNNNWMDWFFLTAAKDQMLTQKANPTMAGFAEGGVVNQPTIALIGEGGEKEYIVPQSKLQDFIGAQSRNNDAIRKPARTILGVVNNFISQFGTQDINRMVGGDILRMERIFGRERFTLPIFTKGEGSFDKIVGDTFKNLVKGKKAGGALSQELYDSIGNLFISIEQFMADIETMGTGPGGGPGGGPGNGEAPTAGQISGSQKEVEKQMFSYLTSSVGLKDFQAAGIIGNAWRESTLRTRAPEGGFEGLFQWNSDRWSRLTRWARSKGLDPYNHGTQIEYAILESKQMGVFEKIKSSTSAEEAAAIWYKDFEIAAERNNYSGSDSERKNNGFTRDVLSRQSGNTGTFTPIGVSRNAQTTSIQPTTQPKSNFKGYIIIPGHASGGGAPGEKELVKKLAKDAYDRIKSQNPNAPVQFMDLDSRFSDDDAGWNAQKRWYEQMEREGYDVLEIHMDRAGGTGRGVIRAHRVQSGPATQFASRYGAYPMDWRSKPGEAPLAGPHRDVDLFELGEMSPGKAYTQRDIQQLSSTFVNSVMSALSRTPVPSTAQNAPSNGLITPARGTLTSKFGWRWGREHQGIDIGGALGTPVVAPEDGLVTYARFNDGGYGNLVIIRGTKGEHYLAHLNTILVRENQRVRANEIVGTMGSTGRSTGVHLHWGVKVNGRFVDPLTLSPSSASGSPIEPSTSPEASSTNSSLAANRRFQTTRQNFSRNLNRLYQGDPRFRILSPSNRVRSISRLPKNQQNTPIIRNQQNNAQPVTPQSTSGTQPTSGNIVLDVYRPLTISTSWAPPVQTIPIPVVK